MMFNTGPERSSSGFTFGSCRDWLRLFAVALLVCFLPLAPAPAEASEHYVAVGGVDAGDCTVASSPCASISYALLHSPSGGQRSITIKIAEGTYVETVKIPFIDGTVRSIQGGWNSDFTSHNVNPELTTIDADMVSPPALDADPLQGSLAVENLTLTNASTGIRISNRSGYQPAVTLRNLVITGNHLGIDLFSENLPGIDVTIENTVVVDNTAAANYAGLVAEIPPTHTAVLNLTILNSTFSGNQAGLCAGVSIFSGSNGTINAVITNSIIWGNTTQTAYGDLSLTTANVLSAQVTYSDVGEVLLDPPITLGTGTFNQDPLFNPTPGDYRLTSSSPCIDSGDNAQAPAIDFEGTPRPLDGDLDLVAIADIGADEYGDWIFFDGFESGDPSEWSASVQ